MMRAQGAVRLLWLLLAAGVGCGDGAVLGAGPDAGSVPYDAATVMDASDAGDPYVADLDFGEALDPVAAEDLVPIVDLDASDLSDPGGPDEDPTDLDEAAYPLEGAGGAGPSFTCDAHHARVFPDAVTTFEARWPAVRDEALLYARCGDIDGNQRLESSLDALVAMYEATAHPRYATRFLTLVEALRAAAVRNGGAYVKKHVRETLTPAPRPGASCARTASGAYFCLANCAATPSQRQGNGLADMYLAEPVFRGLRDILGTATCYLPASSPLRARALRHWSFFRGVLWRRWRGTATALTHAQFHILARYGEMALQLCLRDPSAEPEACALARQRGAFLRANLLPNPSHPGAVLWGSSMGSCDPAHPNLACHTIGGACDGNAGEDRHDCRGPGAAHDATCWRTFCGVTDVSHANTVVGFGLDLARATALGGGAGFTGTEITQLRTTLRDVLWCGNALPVGPDAASVFIDGFDTCGAPAPPETPKRERQRRALALGWYRLGRGDATLLGPMTSHATDLLARSPDRDRTALDGHAQWLRALAAQIVAEGDLLGPGGCAQCPAP